MAKRPSTRMTRREQVAAERAAKREQGRAANASRAYEDPRPVPQIFPKNENQRTAMGYLEDDYPIVLLTGSAGTGKSMLIAHHIAKLYKAKKVDKIYLTRPAVTVGKSLGLLPGTVEEKILPYFQQTLEHLRKFLGKGTLETALREGNIEMQPVEYLRGRSFENCVVFGEEFQNMTPEEIEMFVTRLGEGAKFLITGDQKQHDLKGESGLSHLIKLRNRMLRDHPEYMKHEDIDALDDGMAVVEFTPNDVVRSGLTRALVKMFHYN